MVNGIFTIPLPGPLSRSADELNSTGPRISEFVAGPENVLVAEALRACLARTHAEYDPLVLYGPHGSGKSHLARGLADWWNRISQMPAWCAWPARSLRMPMPHACRSTTRRLAR